MFAVYVARVWNWLSFELCLSIKPRGVFTDYVLHDSSDDRVGTFCILASKISSEITVYGNFKKITVYGNFQKNYRLR